MNISQNNLFSGIHFNIHKLVPRQVVDAILTHGGNLVNYPYANISNTNQLQHEGEDLYLNNPGSEYEQRNILSVVTQESRSEGIDFRWIMDCLKNGRLLDWKEYYIRKASGVVVRNEWMHNRLPREPHDAKFRIVIKGSRDHDYLQTFPHFLFTLTWKYKYDLKIVSDLPVFGEENSLLKTIKMTLTMGKDREPPTYSGYNVDPIEISSSSKASDNEIQIRFGIHRLFCSKRFKYQAFRLKIQFVSGIDEYTYCSPEFRTFVKKSSNLSKYLQYPEPLNEVEIWEKVQIKKRPRDLSYDPEEKKQQSLSIDYYLWYPNSQPLAVNSTGDVFYFGVYKEKTIYQLNDFIIVQQKPNVQWICQIQNFCQTSKGEQKVIGKWFYSWKDLLTFIRSDEIQNLKEKCAPLSPLQHNIRNQSNQEVIKRWELFVSDDVAYLPISSIVRKCDINYLPPGQNIPNPPSHFFSFKYDRKARSLSTLRSDDLPVQPMNHIPTI